MSILGTLIPQKYILDDYSALDGSILYYIFNFLSLYDIYHSIWYRLLIFLLWINILFCTFERLPNVSKLFSKRYDKSIKFKRYRQNFQFESNRSLDSVYSSCYDAILREFKFKSVLKVNKNLIYAETGRWTKIGIHIIHLSIIVLLFGELITAVFGFKGYVNVVEGSSVNQIKLENNDKIINLDFDIRCNKFKIKFYEDGTPKEYVSDLSLLKDDILVIQRDVLVNNPICYKGISIFQSSYGKIPSVLSINTCLPDVLKVEIKSILSGLTYLKNLKLGVPIDLPENLGVFCILEYLRNIVFNGVNLGGGLKCIYSPVGGQLLEELLLPIDYPNFDLMRRGIFAVSLSKELCSVLNESRSNNFSYYTGLQVTKDPGKWIVYGGFILMIFGFLVYFFVSHKKVYIKILENEIGNKVIITGRTNHNNMVMKIMLKRIYERALLSKL